MEKNKVAIALTTLLVSGMAWSQGYVMDPPSRAALCQQGENHCGYGERYRADEIITAAGKNDFATAGKIASAGNDEFDGLNTEGSHWKKTVIGEGPLEISWQLTRPTQVSSWKYYLTDPNWQNAIGPGQRLSAENFNQTPFCTFAGDGKFHQGMITHQCTLPETQGYQLIYAVAELAEADGHPSEKITNIIDVDVIKGQQHSDAAIHTHWQKEIGTLDHLIRGKPLKINAGDTIRVRFFDNVSEVPSREISVTVLPGEEASWSDTVANAINQKYQDVRAGVFQPDGDVQPEKGEINSVYVPQDNPLQGVEITIN
ncbi:lytic polysaccharide monooxygenase [Pantoea cypripedii]|uniref:lytic polysaccharide monooxygenase n=1 Tax=Pantoea cypripedii TaxID=55209 RepID=UPI002FC903CA